MYWLILYTLKSVLSLSVLYVVYWLFLRRDTFFAVNRYYLLSAIFFSLAMPLFNFGEIFANAQPTQYSNLLNTVVITPNSIKRSYENNLSFFQILITIYFTGVAIFSAKFAAQIFNILKIVKRYGITQNKGVNYVFTDSNFAPFSFFNLVFMNQSIETDDFAKILAHEQIHVKQLHSFDIIVLEILTILQWFNPIVWFYKQSLRGIHEYLADEGVIRCGVERVKYQALLLNVAMGVHASELTNNFNKLIKRRFIMMTKSKSNQIAKIKLIIALPFFVALFAVVACNKTVDNNEAEQNKVVVKNQDSVYNEVDVMPEFPGGQMELMTYISKNIVYPEKAKADKIQGKVYVAFVINKNGKVENVTLAKGVNEMLDNEAVRVIGTLPDWTPGKKNGEAVSVNFTIPINFKLQ